MTVHKTALNNIANNVMRPRHGEISTAELTDILEAHGISSTLRRMAMIVRIASGEAASEQRAEALKVQAKYIDALADSIDTSDQILNATHR